ncbi:MULTISPECIES: ATPase [Bacteria]|uniref:F0F1 ATP synthase subunit B family protein n=1 Tax=Bacteria TaxID=2 RepID=UPI0010403026|nr:MULTISPECIES: ATPase [Bacteria]QDM40283.1 ATPase [Altererythrobacter sp. TH136]TCJ37154.1 ATPase [Parafrankia sp. BMG5.11]
MPQFDFGTVFIPQLFWLAVFFVVLYFGIVRLTLPRLGKVMDERTSKIDGDLAVAQSAKDAADELVEQNRVEREANHARAREALAEANAAAAAAREQRVAAAKASTDAHTAAAEQRIAGAREAARVALRDVAAENAQAIVAKLTGSEPSRDAAASAVDAALARG